MPPVLPRISRRHALRALVAVLALLGVLLWWLKPLGEPELKGELTFSTGVRTGVYHRYGELLEQQLRRDMPGVKVRLETSEGSQQNLQRVAAGEADFTVATADAVAKYRQDGKPGAAYLRGCARLYDDYVQLVVPAGSPVQSARDLRGKRVAIGQAGSGVRLISERLLTAAQLDPARDITPVSIGIDTMPAELEAGRIDAFFWSGGLPTNAVRELSERFDIRLVQLGDLVEQLQGSGSPARYYRAAVMPQDAYARARNTSAVATLAVPNLLVTTEGTDPELTERFTRTVILSRDGIGHEVHAAQLVDLRTAIYTDPLDLHEGARRYYRSVKP
ncbi:MULTISPECIES: TAXI family TRAP transporter solute-binding subunit [unclassified Streptomyces]|uniref:TAXI family TRAP transporter solute-binding subunit n=1 Tax=unclassified Streptomyces TaxID=2593676 RepID=UPI00214A9CDC|nr:MULTISPECIES: TAXI family TRAP transporter solute-binding subunit [unclassified Streptomyces]MCX5011330.1 TAXI family TRAP transporter solute-binding subunit [Streptomyces sp. NBC_00555]MCX5611817.1 TAXI family TRAP transporter solute-binding subunit [Streptomyces sp. NBC_00047]UUU39635.1 TAXI family TRAP transporter solute-binding subunit [Streptomyces sp. NBC_00162]